MSNLVGTTFFSNNRHKVRSK